MIRSCWYHRMAKDTRCTLDFFFPQSAGKKSLWRVSAFCLSGILQLRLLPINQDMSQCYKEL